MIAGRLTVAEAVERSFRRPPVNRDRVRWFRVQALRDAGYVVERTPVVLNDDHVSVSASSDDVDWWASPERVTLEQIAEREEVV